MRTTLIAGRAGLTVAAAVLPLGLAAPAFAGGTGVSGISVVASGSTVRVSTAACGQGGTASLMTGTQAAFAQGRQVTLGSGATRSASWTDVGSGTYTVAVVCADGTTAGTQSVTVNTTPTVSATSAPAGVRGGLGGSSTDYRTVTLMGGGALVTVGAVTAALYLRRRARPHRR
ncbi:hypothetical protein ACFV0R_04490 [Streptomyces sp. NPDC059578]|uniref:hypothetical protein n=1 Tax=unclassified Streptomyces TaxID=2593676 RepID=UPI003647DB5A